MKKKNLFYICIIFSGLFIFNPGSVFAATVTGCNGVSFSANLKLGAIGQEATCIQVILNSNPATQIAKTGDGSPGKETDKIGALTHVAIIRFQEKYAAEILKPAGLKKGNGFVGKLTRTKLNFLLAKALSGKQLKVSQTLTGKASYYSDVFQGKKTASGALYDKLKYTAAHKTLPFGTIVRVTNSINGRSVVVKVNDRGPFIAGRVIDLSKIAARDVGLFGVGVANIKAEILK